MDHFSFQFWFFLLCIFQIGYANPIKRPQKNGPSLAIRGSLISCARLCSNIDICGVFIYGNVSPPNYDCGYGTDSDFEETEGDQFRIDALIFRKEHRTSNNIVPKSLTYIEVGDQTKTLQMPTRTDSCMILVGTHDNTSLLKLEASIQCKEGCKDKDTVSIYNIREDVKQPIHPQDQSEGTVVCLKPTPKQTTSVFIAANESFFLIRVARSSMKHSLMSVDLKFTKVKWEVPFNCTDCTDVKEDELNTCLPPAVAAIKPYMKFHSLEATAVPTIFSTKYSRKSTNLISSVPYVTADQKTRSTRAIEEPTAKTPWKKDENSSTVTAKDSNFKPTPTHTGRGDKTPDKDSSNTKDGNGNSVHQKARPTRAVEEPTAKTPEKESENNSTKTDKDSNFRPPSIDIGGGDKTPDKDSSNTKDENVKENENENNDGKTKDSTSNSGTSPGSNPKSSVDKNSPTSSPSESPSNTNNGKDDKDTNVKKPSILTDEKTSGSTTTMSMTRKSRTPRPKKDNNENKNNNDNNNKNSNNNNNSGNQGGSQQLASAGGSSNAGVIGGAVGGSLAGLAATGALIGGLLYRRHKRNKVVPGEVEIDLQDSPPPCQHDSKALVSRQDKGPSPPSTPTTPPSPTAQQPSASQPQTTPTPPEPPA